MSDGAVLSGKILQCGILAGFEVTMTKNDNTKKLRIPNNLAQLKKAGVKGVLENNGELYVDSSVYSKIPVVKHSYKIIGRVKDNDGRVVAYSIQEGNEEPKKVNCNAAWRLAASGEIEGAEAKCVKGSMKKLLVIDGDIE